MSNVYVDRTKPSILYLNEYTIDSDRIDADFYHIDYISNERQLKQSGLEIKPLGKIISKMNSPIGWQGIPSAAYLPKGAGVPLIRVQNVNDLMLDRDTLIGVQEYIYQDQPAIQAEAEDIIITRVGTIGRVCRVPNDVSKLAMGQNLTRIKVDSSIITSEFLTIFMASKYCQLQMKRYAYGGVQPSLTNKNIKQLLVPIPSPEIQKYIGDKVRRAEELREEAKRLKEEAEEILESELKFDLFQEKEKETKEKHVWINEKDLIHRMDSEYYSPKVMCYERILDEFGIPMISLGNIAKQIRTGTTPPNKFITTEKQNLMFLRMTNIDEFIINMDEVLYIKDDYKGTKLKTMEQDDLLVSIAGTIGRATVVDIDNCTINQNTASITINEKDKYNPYYIALFLNSDTGKMLLERVSSQATVKYINNDVLSEVKIPIIPVEIQLNIQKNIKSYITKIKKSKQLNQQAKQDVEDLIEGNFDMSRLNDESSTESRC